VTRFEYFAGWLLKPRNCICSRSVSKADKVVDFLEEARLTLQSLNSRSIMFDGDGEAHEVLVAVRDEFLVWLSSGHSSGAGSSNQGLLNAIHFEGCT